ncbi:MAG TPA: MFS transporter [Mycobacteriales bacterium]|nr:MFS transporter [Mycobacteriales bacterium]
MVLARYRALLRTAGVGRLLFTSLLARMPNGMSALAILLLVTRHNGYARAGLVTGSYVAAAGVSNLLLSRAADRFGPRPVLVPTAFGYAVALSVLALVPADAYVAELLLGVAAGVTSPPVVSVVRGLWPRLLDPESAQAVYGLEATAQELIFISGPALVALIAGTVGAPAAVIVTGVFALVGTVTFVTSPALRSVARVTERVRHRLMRRTRLPLYVAVAAALTIGLNMTDVGVVAFVSGRHASAAAGIVLALWSLGSMVGGLLFGVRAGHLDDVAVGRATVVIALSIAAAALSPGSVGLAVILFAGGSTVAPGLARLYSRVGAVAPEGASTEAFGWVAVGLLAGSSIGAALGGVVVDGLGPRVDFLLAAVAPAVIGLTVLLWLRRQESASLAADPLPS